MRSVTERLVVAIAIALALACAGAAAQPAVQPAVQAAVQAPAAAASAASPRAAAVRSAVAKLAADPLLAGRHKEHELRWKDSKDAPDRRKPTKDELAVLEWLRAFGRFLDDTSRLLVYGLALLVAALLLVGLRHLVVLRRTGPRMDDAPAASHVRDLDVRPESLPVDIGAAAWTLWRAGDVPAALSLLYRGALSRLIHRHGLPIQSAATEGECLDLARSVLASDALRYLTQLVRAWEANTYGGRALSNDLGELLCTGFSTRLDPPPTAAGARA